MTPKGNSGNEVWIAQGTYTGLVVRPRSRASVALRLTICLLAVMVGLALTSCSVHSKNWTSYSGTGSPRMGELTTSESYSGISIPVSLQWRTLRANAAWYWSRLNGALFGDPMPKLPSYGETLRKQDGSI